MCVPLMIYIDQLVIIPDRVIVTLLVNSGWLLFFFCRVRMKQFCLDFVKKFRFYDHIMTMFLRKKKEMFSFLDEIPKLPKC
jgi:hypothetical protein